MAIPIYNDGLYKLLIVPIPQMKYAGVANFYRRDTLLPLQVKSIDVDSKYCQDIDIYRYVYEYRDTIGQTPLSMRIHLYYRYTSFVPEDTAHYTLNYREGIWIDKPQMIAREMRVTYHNDEKHGPATVLDRDSLLYHVNFKHNFTETYEKTIITNLRTGLKHGGSYTYYEILNSCYSPQTNTYPSFSFVKKRRSKQMTRGDALSIYYDKKGLTHDSISYNVKGEFLELIRDTMIIGVEDLYVHDFYKRYTDSLHSFYVRKPEPFVKVPLKDITKVYKDRDLITPMFLTAGLAFASALLVAPLISIQKGGFNADRYASVSLSSLGVMSAAIATGIIFGQKKFVIKRGTKNHRTWKIKPEEY
jgi:hypothetical protein